MAVLKADRYVKVHGLVKVKGWPKYVLIKSLKWILIKISRDKDSEIKKYSIFMLGRHNFVLSMQF